MFVNLRRITSVWSAILYKFLINPRDFVILNKNN